MSEWPDEAIDQVQGSLFTMGVEADREAVAAALESLGGERVCLEWLSNSDAAIWRGMGDENYLLIPLGESEE